MNKKSKAVHDFFFWLNLYETEFPILRFDEDFYICSEIVDTARKEHKAVLQSLKIGDHVNVDLAPNGQLVAKNKFGQSFGYLNRYISQPIHELLKAKEAHISDAKVISLALPTPPQKKALVYIGFWLTSKEANNNADTCTSISDLKVELFGKFKKFLVDNFIYSFNGISDLLPCSFCVNHSTNTITTSCFVANELYEIVKAGHDCVATAHVICNSRLSDAYSIMLQKDGENIGYPITRTSHYRKLSQFLIFLLLLEEIKITNCKIVSKDEYSLAIIDLKCSFDISKEFPTSFRYIAKPLLDLPEAVFTIHNMYNINCILRGFRADIDKAIQVIINYISNTWGEARSKINFKDGLNASIKSTTLNEILELRIPYFLDDVCYHQIAKEIPELKILMFAQDDRWNIYRLYSPSGANGFTEKELIGQIDKYSETSWALENAPDETFSARVCFVQTGDSTTIKYSLPSSIKGDWNDYKYVVKQDDKYQLITDIREMYDKRSML